MQFLLYEVKFVTPRDESVTLVVDFGHLQNRGLTAVFSLVPMK